MHLFELAKVGSDGVTAHAKALHILRTTGKAPSILDGPEMPQEAHRALEWWQDLHAGRLQGLGPTPITWADVHAYLALLSITPAPFEVRFLRLIDRAFLIVNATPPET